MASRDLDQLLTGTKAKWLKVKERHPNLPIFEVCTYRGHEEQAALYAQNREDLETVNCLRRAVGLNLLTDKENSYCVTWTMLTMHEKRRAVDFAFRAPKPFDLKADIDGDSIPDFTEVGKTAVECGLQWGIVNKKGEHVDLGHVQDNEVYLEKEG